MGRLIIRNGRVVDPSRRMDGAFDVLIEGGRVAAVDSRLEVADAEVLDAAGCVVAPGFIDIRTHLREPGISHAETIESGSRAAAAGGFTSVCCLPNTIPVNDSATVTSFIVERARRTAAVNVFPVGALTKEAAGEHLAEFGSMKSAGVVAVGDGRPVMDARVMRRALEYAASFGLTVIDDCEDLNLSYGGDIHEGSQSVRLGLRGIPACAEDVMVARDILLAETTGARLHIAHVSTRKAVEMVRFARSRGVAVTCEVTPHHLTLTDLDIRDYDSNYKMQPPLRSEADRQALLAAVADGAVDAIASDHSPHTGNIKMQEFDNSPFGVTGLETAVALSIEQLVHTKKTSLTRLVELFTTGPARVIGLDRGTLVEGAPGDVTLLSLDREWFFDANRSESKSKNTPFDQRHFRGGPVATVVDGRIIWQAVHAIAA
jgi:dihydroorotase